MGLNTQNSGSVVAGGTPNATPTRKVTVLKGTHVQSVGRDVQVGQIIEVSSADYNFLKPYGYVEDFKEVVAPEPEQETEDEVTTYKHKHKHKGGKRH